MLIGQMWVTCPLPGVEKGFSPTHLYRPTERKSMAIFPEGKEVDGGQVEQPIPTLHSTLWG